MPHFKLNVSVSGPIIDAAVIVSAARAAAMTTAGIDIPAPQVIRALVDTGASHTCVDPSVLQALGLTATGSIDVLTPTTGAVAVSADTYDVGFAVLSGTQGEPHLILPTWKVTAAALFEGQGIHALLGRDVLKRCILHYNGATDEFTLGY